MPRSAVEKAGPHKPARIANQREGPNANLSRPVPLLGRVLSPAPSVTVFTAGCDLNHMPLGACGATIEVAGIVRIHSKVVVFLLLGGLLAGPVAAVSCCWSGSVSASEHCPHCPMMAGSATRAAMIEGAAQGPNCCQLSPAKPSPAPASAAPTDGSNIASPNLRAAATRISFFAVVRKPEEAPPRFLIASQAVLCTFLI